MIYRRISPSHWKKEIGNQLKRTQLENDDALEDADKAIIRLQSERQPRMLKKDKPTLSYGEDDIITHHGVALSTLDDLEDETV